MSRGRSSLHIQSRNAKLAARYYYYAHLVGLHYERCLLYLEKEFDLTTTTISQLITAHNALVFGMRKKELTTQDLAKMYPYLNWQYNHATMSQMSDVQLSIPF